MTPRPSLGVVLASIVVGTTTGILLEHYRRHLKARDDARPVLGWLPARLRQ